jgi:hypothetical protein
MNLSSLAVVYEISKQTLNVFLVRAACQSELPLTARRTVIFLASYPVADGSSSEERN